MLNLSASLAMSTSVLKAEPGKLDIKRHSPSILCVLKDLLGNFTMCNLLCFHGNHTGKCIRRFAGI